MSNLDIIALVVITLHSIYRACKPKEGTFHRTAVGNFFITFIVDAVVYLLCTFLVGLIFGSFMPLAILNFISRS